MTEPEPRIEDTDSDVLPARDEEADHNLATKEVLPADEQRHSPFMEIEEATLPPDFPRLF